MYSLGLSKDACLDFLRKQVEDTSLSKGALFFAAHIIGSFLGVNLAKMGALTI